MLGLGLAEVSPEGEGVGDGDDRAFLDTLDPAAAGRELVDDRFVKKAVIAAGGMATFGLPESFTRTEVVAA